MLGRLTGRLMEGTMPAGANHAGRTRADRKKITVPVTAAELAMVDRRAARRGVSRAEYVRLRCLGDSHRERMISVPYIVGVLRDLLGEVPASGPARERLEALIEQLR